MVGETNMLVSELLCESVGLRAGERVLDIATGSGNTAISAARRGCRVTGIDWVPALLDRARERSASERLKIEYQHGDAEAIPFPDGVFDVVLTTFGAMFAADPMKAASEMLRVCRSGGRIGMANWVPAGMIGEMFKINATFAPPPKDVPPPSQWGIEEHVRQRFGAGVSRLELIPRQLVFRQYSPEAWVEFMKKWFGPMIRAHQVAGDRAPELTAALVDMVRRHNKSGDESLYAPADYVEVIAVKA